MTTPLTDEIDRLRTALAAICKAVPSEHWAEYMQGIARAALQRPTAAQESSNKAVVDSAEDAARPAQTVGHHISLNVKHPLHGEAADAFWKYWRENGETHKHGYYESTWGAINAALRLVGVVEHPIPDPDGQESGSASAGGMLGAGTLEAPAPAAPIERRIAKTQRRARGEGDPIYAPCAWGRRECLGTAYGRRTEDASDHRERRNGERRWIQTAIWTEQNRRFLENERRQTTAANLRNK